MPERGNDWSWLELAIEVNCIGSSTGVDHGSWPGKQSAEGEGEAAAEKTEHHKREEVCVCAGGRATNQAFLLLN